MKVKTIHSLPDILIPSIQNYKPSGAWTPSECCSPRVFDHPPTVFRQKSIAADLEGCLPCPGSLF